MLHNIDRMSLSKLGQGKSCDRRRGFEKYLSRISKSSQKHYIGMIIDLYIYQKRKYTVEIMTCYYLGIDIKFKRFNTI